MKMHKVDRKKLPALLARLQEILRLQDQRILISDELPAEENQAEIQPWPGKDGAWLRFQDETFDTPRQCMVHELVHLHSWQFECFLEFVLNAYISDMTARKVITREMREHLERFTDRLAYVLNGLIPEEE